MLTPDYELERHVGYALSLAHSRAWSRGVALCVRVAVLGSLFLVLGKVIVIAAKSL